MFRADCSSSPSWLAELMVYTHTLFHRKNSVQNNNIYHWLFMSVDMFSFFLK